MELRIYIRQYQFVNKQHNAIIFTGANPHTIVPTLGTVDSIWHDFTDDVVNIDKIQLQWTVERDVGGSTTPGAYNPKKSTSGSLTFVGKAYDYLKVWLIENVASGINAVEVKVQDTSCGYYESYMIKGTQISWCENQSCEFELNLKQLDDQWACIQREVISDNWQGWFDIQPKNGKKHPRFSYCNEKRPNGVLVITWWFIAMFAMVFAPLITVILAIVYVIQLIINAIAWIVGLNGVTYVDPTAAFEMTNQMLLESAGCGREHPAPLIRDYISNICDKCGLRVDETTAPIFYSKTLTMTTSNGFLSNEFNPHYNACLLYAPKKRGIRRKTSIDILNKPDDNDTDFYIPDNSPIYPLSDFLDMLKEVYNAEWRVKGGYLYFWRKDWYTNGAFLYDFSMNSDDRLKILEGICFEPSETKYPAFVRGLWAQDPVDTCGNEVLGQMNGTYSFCLDMDNAYFEGELNKITTKFGGTKFRLDGAATDYVYDAIQVVVNGSFFAPPLGQIFKDFDSTLGEYANYALLMRDESCGLPKILLWDGDSFMNAKCIRNVVPVNNDLVPAPGNPIPNSNQKYPDYDENGNTFFTKWIDEHPAYTNVKGAALTPGSSDMGVYEVRMYLGSLVCHNAARLVNYPMYFEPKYLGTMWDWFHFIDDPRFGLTKNIDWNVKIELCCEDLNKLRVMGDASQIELLSKVKLPFTYYPDGIITDITVSYDGSGSIGRYIELRGKM